MKKGARVFIYVDMRERRNAIGFVIYRRKTEHQEFGFSRVVFRERTGVFHAVYRCGGMSFRR